MTDHERALLASSTWEPTPGATVADAVELLKLRAKVASVTPAKVGRYVEIQTVVGAFDSLINAPPEWNRWAVFLGNQDEELDGLKSESLANDVAALFNALPKLLNAAEETVRLRAELARIGPNDRAHASTWCEEAERLSDQETQQRFRAEKAEAENERLRAALRPFAEYLEGLKVYPYHLEDDREQVAVGSPCIDAVRHIPTLGDCRRAAEALTP